MINKKTKNISFLKTAQDLLRYGVSSELAYSILNLNDASLAEMDTDDDPLLYIKNSTLPEKYAYKEEKIKTELSNNIYYYLREIAKVPLFDICIQRTDSDYIKPNFIMRKEYFIYTEASRLGISVFTENDNVDSIFILLYLYYRFIKQTSACIITPYVDNLYDTYFVNDRIMSVDAISRIRTDSASINVYNDTDYYSDGLFASINSPTFISDIQTLEEIVSFLPYMAKDNCFIVNGSISSVLEDFDNLVNLENNLSSYKNIITNVISKTILVTTTEKFFKMIENPDSIDRSLLYILKDN